MENKGQIIAKEGDECKKVYVIMEGEMEVLKTNLVKVFFNSDTGVVAIPEDNEKG